MFGRATITLDIGPHSSCVYFVLYLVCVAFVLLGLVSLVQSQEIG